jgi:hypothetical protein
VKLVIMITAAFDIAPLSVDIAMGVDVATIG